MTRLLEILHLNTSFFIWMHRYSFSFLFSFFVHSICLHNCLPSSAVNAFIRHSIFIFIYSLTKLWKCVFDLMFARMQTHILCNRYNYSNQINGVVRAKKNCQERRACKWVTRHQQQRKTWINAIGLKTSSAFMVLNADEQWPCKNQWKEKKKII